VKLFSALALTFAACASPGDRGLTVYGGQYLDNSLPNDLLVLQDFDPVDSYLAAVAYSQVLGRKESYRWEVEEQFAQHFGDQNHQEVNALLLFRLTQFPWHEFLPTTFAIGDGLSYAFETPTLEESLHAHEGGTDQLLNYLLLELTFAAPEWKRWSLVARLHHRSGVFGLFNDVEGGSNILAFGLRYDF